MWFGPYLIRRLLWAVPTLIGITLVTFLMTRLAPGDPATARLSEFSTVRLTASEHERLRAYLGLDQSVWSQYGRWLSRAVRLDFGKSWSTGRNVSEIVLERIGPTLGLALAALGLALALAVPIGLYSAARAGGWFDRISGIVLSALYAFPNYAAALGLVALVSVKLDWLPALGRRSMDYASLAVWGRAFDLVEHSVLITVCLAYPLVAYQARFVRNSALEIVRAPFIAAARARGVSEWGVFTRHVLPGTLIVLVTLLGLLFPAVVSGAVVLEYVFSWPGIGSLFVDSLFARDYPVVMALTVMTAGVVLVGNLLVDISYALLDPRVGYE